MNERERKAYQMEVIRQAAEHRGAIIGCYAQVEFLLGDIVVRCQSLPEYATLPDSFPYKPNKRPGRVRRILEMPGPLSVYKDSFERIMSALEKFEELRHFMAHGYMEVRTRGSIWHQLSYNLYREREGDFILLEINTNLDALAKSRREIAQYAQEAVSLIGAIYLKHGLERASK